MTNTQRNQDLSERIERLVREELSATRSAAQAAVDRAFASHVGAEVKRRAPTEPQRRGARRASSDLAALGERFYEAVCSSPGETMAVLAPVVDATSRELHRSVTRLKRAGRIRSVGARHSTRYFPMASAAQAAE